MKDPTQLPVPAAVPENLFDFDHEQPGFASLAHNEGFILWWASDIARLLGYASLDTLDVRLGENFVQERRARSLRSPRSIASIWWTLTGAGAPSDCGFANAD